MLAPFKVNVPVPFFVNLRPASVSFFGAAPAPMPSRLDWDRATLAKREPVPLATLCILERVPSLKNGAAFDIRRLSRIRAFPAILTYAYCFNLEERERKRNMLHAYLELSRRVPVLQVRYQSGFQKLPAILDGIGQAVNQVLLESE